MVAVTLLANPALLQHHGGQNLYFFRDVSDRRILTIMKVYDSASPLILCKTGFTFLMLYTLAMQVGDYIKTTVDGLASAGIETARLDCLVLVEDVTGYDRSTLLAHPEIVFKENQLIKLNEFIERRTRHEPLAYIRGVAEFYGRKFIVNKHVLVPRPESETIIDLLKKLIALEKSSPLGPVKNAVHINENEKWTIVDVGTGSGCLALTANLEIPNAVIHASDINSDCIKIAELNAKKLGAEVKFHYGDLLEPLTTLFSEQSRKSHQLKNLGVPVPHSQKIIIIANLPYVPDNHPVNDAAMMEPRSAIFGGADGLNLYRRMFGQLTKLTKRPPYIFTESLPMQHNTLASIAKASGYSQEIQDDFIQMFSIAG